MTLAKLLYTIRSHEACYSTLSEQLGKHLLEESVSLIVHLCDLPAMEVRKHACRLVVACSQLLRYYGDHLLEFCWERQPVVRKRCRVCQETWLEVERQSWMLEQRFLVVVLS